MSFFKNKNLWMKIGIAILVIALIAFALPNCVHADDEKADNWMSSFGGKLISSILKLFVGIADGAMALLQKAVFGLDDTLLHVDVTSSVWLKIIAGIVIAVVAIAAIAATIVSGGTVAAIILGVVSIVLKTGLAVAITYAIAIPLAENQMGDDVYLPVFAISPYEIFANDVPTFNVNFFSDDAIKEIKKIYNDDDAAEKSNMMIALRETISSWYVTLRYIALVAMLSILVYIGIRILMSSTASDKAKYKQLIVDWVVGMCILFIMHYGMAFANVIVDKITDMVDAVKVTSSGSTERDGIQQYKIGDKDIVKKFKKQFGDTYWGQLVVKEGGTEYLYWTADNFLQQARMNGQMQFGTKIDASGNPVLDDDGKPIEYTSYDAIGWRLIYVALVIYTFIFTFIYIRRFIYMAFLTMIAPLVAITYPLDKASDGKAQGFDMWMKEYIFNLLLQPLHLLLYMILIGSAIKFASLNPIYVVVALGFMIPAEKFLRKMFNFEKATTPGMFGGVAGGALMMSGIRSIMGHGPKGPGKDGPGGAGGKGDSDSGRKPRFNEPNKPDNIYGGSDNPAIGDGESDSDRPPRDDEGHDALPDNDDADNEDEKTDLQKMSDAEYEQNFLGADQFDLETMDANAREAYGDENNGNQLSFDEFKEQMGYETDEEMYDQLGITREDWDGPSEDGNEQPIEIGDNNNPPEDNPRPPQNRDEMIRDDSGRNNNKSNRKRSRLGNAIRYGASRYWSNQKANAIRRVSSHPGRKIARVVGGFAAGATFATAGAIAGMVEGSPSKAFANAALGAKGGYTLGGNTVGAISNKFQESNGGVLSSMKRGYYGEEEMRNKEHAKAVKEWMTPERREKMTSTLDVKGKEAEAIAKEYHDMGIHDEDSMLACERLIQDTKYPGIKDRKGAAAVAKLHDSTIKGNTTKMDMTGLEKTIKNNLSKNGWSGEQLDKQYDLLCDMNNVFDGYKKNIADRTE